MSLLIDETGPLEERFRTVGDEAELAATDGAVIVPLSLAGMAIAARRNVELGITVPNTATIDEVAPFFDAAALISVEFPAFSDGRGLSLARRLRRRGFTGRLRASGPLIADQFAEALACGFDEVALPAASAERQPAAQWMHAKDIVDIHYQGGYGGGESILQKRLAAARR